MMTNVALCILVFSCCSSMFKCDYRTSVLSHGLGFNTTSLHSLNINFTSLGRTFGTLVYNLPLKTTFHALKVHSTLILLINQYSY